MCTSPCLKCYDSASAQKEWPSMAHLDRPNCDKCLKLQLNKIHNPTLLLTDGQSVSPTASARNLGFIF